MLNRKRSIFSYSKSEFRGILVLAVLMGILLMVRIRQYTGVGQMELFISEWTPEDCPGQDDGPDLKEQSKEGVRHFSKPDPVDPNHANYSALRAAGLSSGAAGNLIRYREAGGRFATVGEMKRIYGIDSAQLAVLVSNFIIGKDGEDKSEELKGEPNRSFRIELNRADPGELARLPGIGEVLSGRITKYRELLGGYYSANQLSEVYGIDDSLKNTLLEYLSVDTGLLSKTDLNLSSFEVLQKHPYINRYQARSIMEYRRLKGAFENRKSLINSHIFTNEEYDKLKHYLRAADR